MGSTSSAGDDDWLALAAEMASKDAGGVPVDVLGDYLPMLADAATFGRFPGPEQIDAVDESRIPGYSG